MKKEKNSWRLSSDLVAYFPSDRYRDRVYLASPEKKSYKSAVQKIMDSSVFSEVQLESNVFNLKIEEDLSIHVKCSDFPDPNKYYEVGNFHRSIQGWPVIGKIITQIKNNKANFEDVEFEAVFSEDYPGDVYFISAEMSEYKSAFEEMKRRMNCSLNKKVKKWIPGNRYDTLTDTYYFLGEFKSRKSNELNSDYLEDSKMTSVYLYTSELMNETKISEVLKSRKLGVLDEDINILYSLPSAVDSGKVLENDVNNIEDFHEDILNNSIKGYSEVSEYGYLKYLHTKHIFNILSIQGDNNSSNKPSVINSITTVIKNLLTESLLTYWDTNRNNKDQYIGKDNSIEENIKNLTKRFYYDIKDENSLRCLYYPKLFSELGIDVESIAEKVIINNSPEELIKDNFKSYLSTGSIYFQNHHLDKTCRVSKQRIKSTNYSLDIVTLEQLFPNTQNLLSDLKQLIEFARGNYGLGVRNYYETNIGTKKSPKVYVTINVNILDLINYYGGIDKVPQTVSTEIMSDKFWNLEVLIDKDGELK